MVKKQIITSNSGKIPVGVKILSILAYIGAAFTLLAGLAMLFGASAISALISQKIPMMGASLVGIGLIIVGIIFIALSVLDFFIGKGLWNGQNWARILVLVFAVLSVLGSLMPFDIVSIVISGLIIWYLGFNKEAVAYFK